MRLSPFALLALAASTTLACGNYDDSRLHSLALQAVSENPQIASAARNALRDVGQAGVDALLSAHRGMLDAPTDPKAVERVRLALDAVGQQRDCHASGLCWHTDLAKAKAEAQRGSKPILSLRLLGKLNEELSCANSRFFRTTLYANAEVSKFLRDHFVLHWQSVRPAPLITIDFGDGRKIERTITGNSIHYVLDSDGRPLDALPGVYGAKAFVAELTQARDAYQHLASLAEPERSVGFRSYHQEQLAGLRNNWRADALKAGASINPESDPTWAQLRDAMTDALWSRIAQLHPDNGRVDASSRKLIQQKNPNAWQAGRLALSKAVVEDPMLRLIRNLERSIAEDTVRNEYVLHAKIHQWFAEGSAPMHLEVLNNRIYAELFLTPSTDPWLGLADGYAALERNGLVLSKQQ